MGVKKGDRVAVIMGNNRCDYFTDDHLEMNTDSEELTARTLLYNGHVQALVIYSIIFSWHMID